MIEALKKSITEKLHTLSDAPLYQPGFGVPETSTKRNAYGDALTWVLKEIDRIDDEETGAMLDRMYEDFTKEEKK